MMSDALRAVILGIVEGVTEFLPVSSTGHLLLAERFFDLGEGSFWKSFAILIQLGAILAIVALYFGRLWRIALGMFSDPYARRFVIGVLVAFLPAAVIGGAAGGYIKAFLFNPWVVCFSLMVGAFAYDFYKNRADMTSDHLGIIAIGFVVSFVTAMIVVKAFLTYVTRHGFTLFAWWRVIVGTLGLIALAMGRSF